MSLQERKMRLPAHVSRILYVKNLPFKITGKELYSLFGKYGAIRQIRLGDMDDKKARGNAFVVYEDILDAKNAVDHLAGFAVGGRYLSVLFYNPVRRSKPADLEELRQRKKAAEEAAARAKREMEVDEE